MSKIVVKDTEINVIQINEEDYICLTDMIKRRQMQSAIPDDRVNRAKKVVKRTVPLTTFTIQTTSRIRSQTAWSRLTE